MAPTRPVQPSDKVQRGKRKLGREVATYEKAAMDFDVYLKEEEAELEDLRESNMAVFDNQIDLFEKAQFNDENTREIVDLETNGFYRNDYSFLWLKVSRNFENKFYPKEKKRRRSRMPNPPLRRRKRREVQASSDDESVEIVSQKGVRLPKLQDFKLILFFGNRMEWTRFW